MNHYLVRVYPNGQAKHTVRDAVGMRFWLEYNRQYRGGNGLFVDGKVDSPGGLNPSKVAQVETILQAELAAGKIDLNNPDRIGPQIDAWGSGHIDRYTGYRPEPCRASFTWEHKHA